MPCNKGPPMCGPSPEPGEPPPGQPGHGARAHLQRTDSTQTLPDVTSSSGPQGGSFTETGSAKHEQRRLELDRETKWYKLPLAQWMQRYAAGDELPSGVAPKPFMIDLDNQERGMYDGLVAGLNDVLAAVGWAGYEALSTDRLPDIISAPDPAHEDNPNVLRPDLGIYPKTDSERADLPRVVWSAVEVLMEVKWDTRAFPFSSRHTPRSSFLPSGRERCLTRGQLVEYATEVFNRQHRQSVFAVLFLQDCARFVRFDRSSAVVSEEFNYLAHPEILSTFLRRLSKMSLGERGYDPSATRASGEEEETFRSLHARYPEGSATQRGLLKAASAGWPVYKLTCDAPFSPNDDALARGTPPSRRQFLVGRPSSVSHSLVGRGTRTFVAYDITAGRVVSLKDTWRVDSGEVRSELETYLHLRENATGELYIPTLLGGGDVLVDGQPQRTDAAGTQEGRVHARLVFKEICRPLEDFTNAFELVKCVTWALVAHAKAWRDCDLLHRDISTDSILIYDAAESGMPHPLATSDILANWELASARPRRDPVTTVELLAGWDLAVPREIHDPGGPERRGEPIPSPNSWPFVSAHLQEHPEAPHALADDLESFMHVLNFCALKHLSHPDALPTDELTYLLQAVYHAVVPASGRPSARKGSPLKLERVQNGTPFVRGLPADHPLGPLLGELSRLCKLHYEHAHPPAATMRAPAPALSPTDSIDGGVVCGLPNFDVDMDVQVGPMADAQPVTPVRDPASSPLRDHTGMMNACMRAIRQTWPRADRAQRQNARASHRTARKRTWSSAEMAGQAGVGGKASKRARKNSSAGLVSGVRAQGVRKRGSLKC